MRDTRRTPTRGVAMSISVTGEQCATCENQATKSGWCVRCNALFGDGAWAEVGKRQQRKAAK